jgi:predicted transposase YbfD/YdcC
LLIVKIKELEKVMREHVKEFIKFFKESELDVAFDGKSIRGSYDRYKELDARHLLICFIQQFGLIIAQRDVTEDKTNEIPVAQNVIPEMIEEFKEYELQFSADAMHCQEDTISIDGGDFVLQVKDNQSKLLQACQQRASVDSDYEVGRWESNKGHGRLEKRRTSVYKNLCKYDKEKFTNVATVVRTERTRIESLTGEVGKETSWHVSTRELGVKEAGKAVRGHWGIENRVNNVLDNTFLEDRSRIRIKPEIFCLLRAIALNILRMNEVDNIAQKRKELSYSEKDMLELQYF